MGLRMLQEWMSRDDSVVCTWPRAGPELTQSWHTAGPELAHSWPTASQGLPELVPSPLSSLVCFLWEKAVTPTEQLSKSCNFHRLCPPHTEDRPGFDIQSGWILRDGEEEETMCPSRSSKPPLLY